jgi:hypothetical protein
MANKNLVSSLVRRILKVRPRRFHAYCVGAAKTGTTSIAHCFFPFYRSQHEAEVEETNRLVISYLEGRLNAVQVKNQIVLRDQRLSLELESSHPLGYLCDVLASTFSEAKFIVTLREPLDWLHSRLNFHHRVDPPAWREYRSYFWIRNHHGYAPQEKELEKYGLCGLDTYLAQYADHYARVLTSVPKDRRIVVKTSELHERLWEIAEFTGASPSRVRFEHRNESSSKIRPLDSIDPEYVRARILSHCESLIRDFFPERLDFYLGRVKS